MMNADLSAVVVGGKSRTKKCLCVAKARLGRRRNAELDDVRAKSRKCVNVRIGQCETRCGFQANRLVQIQRPRRSILGQRIATPNDAPRCKEGKSFLSDDRVTERRDCVVLW